MERYIQLKACKHVDEFIPHATEQDLEDILRAFKIDVRIVGEEYKDKNFTGRKYAIKTEFNYILKKAIFFQALG